MISYYFAMVQSERQKCYLLFCKATGMTLSEQKSTLTTFNLDEDIVRRLLTLVPFLVTPLDDGMKYLGFRLKPNCYKKEDSNWLVAKLEQRVNNWCNRWLSRAGRLVMFKYVMEAIPLYWIPLAWIPKSILEKSWKICSKFI